MTMAADDKLDSAPRPKLFGIGLNKTGTKSLEVAYLKLGYRIGQQAVFESLFDDFVAGRRDAFFREVDRFEAFQDIPFSIPGAYRILVEHYPDARYILTVRDSVEQWVSSMLRFHAKLFGSRGATPTSGDLARATYVAPGWVQRVMTQGYGASPDNPYDPARLRDIYEFHVADVTRFFADRPGQLLVLNVESPDAHIALSRFLGMDGRLAAFPHKNITG
ncbi:MAG: hypothetical protein K8T26_00895 [Lentisphaerae bacterium]|nr:hypothetical protein [Lentisphaerota bacterium]